MGKKYIIKLEDSESVYKTIIANGYPMLQVIVPAPYTEPDLEQVRKEAYEDGYKTAKVQCNIQAEKDLREVGERHYQKGLSDAWEAARKIIRMPEGDLLNLFTECYSAVCTSLQVFLKYDASECIEKIRQYEQKQEKKDGVWIASETWIVSEANEPSVDTTLICSKCGYAIKIKPHETPALNFCPKCGDCKKPKEEES